ncbi:AMP-binding protein [Paludibacterium paludis]|uniref:Acyl-CoA synthetase n=1 Tax=Paludibacterium paludis TaxID=1225769 RepID=A0A918P3J5_9NEIS|nr:AMP-binding protein [Paludibacterium paludis]GGY18480.1 acyl-CoA synthetase [Paludibacterium paludis]
MKTLLDMMRYRAEENGDLVAYRELDSRGQEVGQISFAQLWRRAGAVARGLLAAPETGNAILLLFPPGIDFMVAFTGVVLAGKIAVPSARPGAVGLKRAVPRLARICANCAAGAILADDAFLAEARDQENWFGRDDYHWLTLSGLEKTGCASGAPLPAADLDRLAYLQYSSGSTGEPKGVMITHRNIAANVGVMEAQMGYPGRIVSVEWMPHFHDYSLVKGLLMALYTGGEHVILPPMTILRAPHVWLRAVSDYRAWRSGGPNFAYQQCLDAVEEADIAGLDLSNWHWAHCGAEPIKSSTVAGFMRRFAPAGLNPSAFRAAYGMAEATLFLTSSRLGEPWKPMPVRPGDSDALTVACGVAGAGIGLRIVDPECRHPLPDGQVGEIWVADESGSVSSGYWNEPQLSREVFQATLADGSGRFLRTGDLGYLNKGELVISGRLKDLIIYQGRNIVPTDIEWLAQSGRPDLRVDAGAAFADGDALSPRLVLVQEADKPCPAERLPQYAEQIQASVAASLGLALDEIVFIRAGSLPKTSSGKIQRSLCRTLLREGRLPVLLHHRSAPGGDARPGRQTAAVLEAHLAGLLADHLGVGRAGVQTERSLFEQGLDSNALTGFYELLHRRHPEWKLDLTDLFQYPSLALLAGRIAGAGQSGAERVDADRARSTQQRNRQRMAGL